jgi:hypothetical protein
MFDLPNCSPETVPVILCHGMACVGCPMSRGEMMEGPVAAQGLDRDSFVGRLQEIVSNEEAVD